MRARDILAMTLVAIGASQGGAAADSPAACAPMPALVHAEQGAYPTDDLHAPSQITVLVELMIQPDGSVSKAAVLSKDPPDIVGWSDAPILAAAARYRFKPVPKACVGSTRMVFRIAEASTHNTSLEWTRDR